MRIFMRRVQRITLGAAVFIALLLSPLFGGTTTSSATLNISVTVPKTVAISVESTSDAEGIDFTDDPRDLLLGVVRERNNSFDGYQVYLTSENAAALESDRGHFTSTDGSNSSQIPYVVSYGGTLVEFDRGTARVTDYSGEPAMGEGHAKEVRLVRLDRQEAALPDPGSYSDTLTFTIAAK